LQALYTQKLAEGLSPTTVHHIHMMLHRAISRAQRLGLVVRNVTEMVDPPRIANYSYVTLDAQQVNALLEAVRGDRVEALYVVALTTGMRQGELLALRWQDVDFDHATIQVRATLHFNGSGFAFSEPKTAYSRRQVALSRRAIQALQHHRLRQEKEIADAGKAWDSTLNLVFPNTVGKPVNPSNLMSRDLLPLLQQLNLPRICFHDLQHTCATLMLKAGVHPKVVSEMLGHSHISVTLGVYSHVTPDMQRDAVAAFEKLLGD
jgi:integrase